MVAPGAREHLETLDVSLLYEPAAPRGVVDVRAGPRRRADQECGRAVDPSQWLWRKGSFGTQSEEGSRFVESMITVVSTLKQQQRNILASLTAACEAALRSETALSLLPANAHQEQATA